jgi:hypothetical protein
MQSSSSLVDARRPTSEVARTAVTSKGDESCRLLPQVLPRNLFTTAPSIWFFAKYLRLLATPAGFEPATFSLEGVAIPSRVPGIALE